MPPPRPPARNPNPVQLSARSLGTLNLPQKWPPRCSGCSGCCSARRACACCSGSLVSPAPQPVSPLTPRQPQDSRRAPAPAAGAPTGDATAWSLSLGARLGHSCLCPCGQQKGGGCGKCWRPEEAALLSVHCKASSRTQLPPKTVESACKKDLTGRRHMSGLPAQPAQASAGTRLGSCPVQVVSSTQPPTSVQHRSPAGLWVRVAGCWRPETAADGRRQRGASNPAAALGAAEPRSPVLVCGKLDRWPQSQNGLPEHGTEGVAPRLGLRPAEPVGGEFPSHAQMSYELPFWMQSPPTCSINLCAELCAGRRLLRQDGLGWVAPACHARPKLFR